MISARCPIMSGTDGKANKPTNKSVPISSVNHEYKAETAEISIYAKNNCNHLNK